MLRSDRPDAEATVSACAWVLGEISEICEISAVTSNCGWPASAKPAKKSPVPAATSPTAGTPEAARPAHRRCAGHTAQ